MKNYSQDIMDYAALHSDFGLHDLYAYLDGEADISRQTVSWYLTKLTESETQLIAQQIRLEAAQRGLEDAQSVLASQQEELSKAQSLVQEKENEIAAQKEQLDALSIQLGNQQTQIDEQQKALEDQQMQIEALVGMRTRIISSLSSALKEASISAQVDPTNGSIALESDVMFELGSYDLSERGERFIDRFLPVYLDVLFSEEYRSYVSEILIEGHTGRSFSDPVLDANGFEDMDASRRVVFKFRLTDEQMIQQLKSILEANET